MRLARIDVRLGVGGLRKKFTEHLQKQWVCTIHIIQYGDVPEHILFKTFFLTDRTSNVYRCCAFLSSIVVIHVGGTRDHHLYIYIESHSCIMTLPSRKPFTEARTYTNTHIYVYIYIIFICICAYVYYIHAYIYICILMYTCIYIYIYLYVHVCKSKYTYTKYMYIYIRMYVYIYVYMYICMARIHM